MAAGKISREQGPTQTPLVGPQIRRAMLGGERSLVGSSSSLSTDKTPQSDKSNETDPQSPAQTMENPSQAPETETSTAHSTDTNGPGTGVAKSVKSGKRAAKKSTDVTEVDEDEFEDI